MTPMTQRRWLRAASALLVSGVFLLTLGWSRAGTGNDQDYPHLRMGNPSKATEDESQRDNFLMKKDEFALSYNDKRGTPNWVSWRLAKEDEGDAPRKNFHPDLTLPGGFTKILPTDYSGSGFDRGHMCPHSDRAKTDDTSFATFVLTNMVPQSPQNNQKAWDQLEMYCRDLAFTKKKVCYIVAGPLGQGGVGRNGFRTTTPKGRVVVPAVTWKVIMVLNKDVADPAAMTENTHIRLIGVIVPNTDQVGFEWAGFRVPVRKIEELTGYTFFDRVPANLIDHLKDEHDEVPIPPPTPAHHAGE